MTTAAELTFTPFDQYLESESEVKHEWINGLVYVEELRSMAGFRPPSFARCLRQASAASIRSLEEYVLISHDEQRVEVRRRTGRNWAFEIKTTGEIVRLDGRELDVDSLYT